MDSKKVGIAAASLLGAATLLTASPAHADDVICDCPIVIGPGGTDAYSKIESSFVKLFVKFDDRSTQLSKIQDAFLKINEVFFGEAT